MIDTSKVDINKAQVLAELQRHQGADNGIHIRDLVGRITNSVLTGEAHERKVRELIQELRMDKYPICGHPGAGYYMAQTPEELNKTCAFLLSRADTSVAQIARMKGREPPDLYQLLGIRRPAPITKEANHEQ